MKFLRVFFEGLLLLSAMLACPLGFALAVKTGHWQPLLATLLGIVYLGAWLTYQHDKQLEADRAARHRR